ncbi:alanyl (membrane) aminopeptidase-like b [Astyanax mexicanus]|uniref:alanyl (membrane) aminopeptidase-like b n=1 Tax=Astyanax mexicanus TaxID=7994 RepID=UPI0020CADAF6|nr:alanyl (membrane) aminopeptidase-like b [Astyanax mexicanus]
MGKGVYISKGLAIATVVLTVSAVSGIVLMVVMYQLQIKENPPKVPPTLIPTTPIPTGPPPNLRLPDNLIPERYEVFLQPYFYTVLENNTVQSHVFKGNSTVTFKCVKDTRSIFLHALQLSVSNVKVTDSVTRKNIEVERYEVHINKTNFFEIQLKEVLNGNGSYYELFTEFEGELLDDLAGLYMSRYTENPVNEDDDQKRFLMASQMQPTDARKVFPCFDEPALKAVFSITIIHRPETKARSNTPGEGKYTDIDGEQWIVTKFEPTPIMSTYLLAFTVNQFTDKEVKLENKEIRIWAKPEAINAGHASYSLQITKDILAFYEELFGLKYPLRKLDQIAIPDFGAGAMENWGLIMYRETALLYEEGVSSTSNKEWIATVIAHELAHQWFGNLVTMKWWNNLWLSEGFATYISYLGVNKVEPTWDILDLIVLKEVQPAMEVDSLNSSHPLSSTEAEIQTTAEISDLFDSISYSKGAAVLRMLCAHIGETAFFEGLKLYLKNNQYQSTDTTDLWKYMKEVSTEDVESIMYGWTEQVGYPVISINTSTGEIWQEQFLLNQTGDYGLEWQVPIRFMKSPLFKVEKEVLREKGPVARPAYDLKPGEWLLANINCTGYYRVNYDEENWYKLIDQMETDHHDIPLISRGQLIDDAFNLARAKYVNVTLALSTTKYLINETEYIPWESALNNLQYFILMFDRSEVYGPMQKYLRKQVGPLYDYFQEYTDNATVPEKHSEQFNQINAISVACSNDVQECTEMATKLFKDWRNGTNRIPPNLKSTIYCSAIASGDEDDWDFAWNQYEKASIATEKDKLRYALSCTKKMWLLNRYLEYTLEPSKIRKMDAVSTINHIARNVAGQALAWDFIRAHWTEITEEYGSGLMSVGSLIDEVTERFSTEFELQQLKQFRREHYGDGPGPAARALEQAIERTEANIEWVKENKQTVMNWFLQESKDH